MRRLAQAVGVTTVVPVSDALIDNVAQLRWECRQAGHPLAAEAHTADLWIAATARHVNAVLITADSVFVDVPGLIIEPN